MAALAQRTAGVLGRVQTGSLHLYAFLALAGTVAVLLWSWRHV
jgi:NADH-quinone oxidoreductase subunit L